MQSALSAHKIPINTKTAFFRSFGTGSNFVGEYFYKKKLWKVKILTFEGEA